MNTPKVCDFSLLPIFDLVTLLDTDCVILDVNYDHTGNFSNHNISNWEPVNCLNSLNGALGHAHGFLCTDNIPG